MRKNKKVLALILSMVNVLGLSKSNANPKGESTKGTIVNGEKNKIETTKREMQNVSWLDVFLAKRTLGEGIGILLLSGCIYKQNRDINSLREIEKKNREIEKKNREIEKKNKEVIKPNVSENKENKNYLDPQLKKFLGFLAEKADKEFENFVKSRNEIKTLFADEDLSAKDFPNADPNNVNALLGLISEKNKSKLFFSENRYKYEGDSYDDYRKFAGVAVKPFTGVGGQYLPPFYSDYFSPIDNSTKREGNTGWKIHISPDVFHCKDVLELVYQYHEKNKIHGKFIKTLPFYRHFNKLMLSEGIMAYQVGKFITIYPKNDQEAKDIVNKLHDAFEKADLNEDCFLEISDDFKVYPGIYVRMSEFSGKLDDSSVRGKLGIPSQVFTAYCKTMKTKDGDYQYPFEKLYARGVEMPKKVCEINNKLKEIEKK